MWELKRYSMTHVGVKRYSADESYLGDRPLGCTTVAEASPA